MVQFFFLLLHSFPFLILPVSDDRGSDLWGFVHAPCQDWLQAPTKPSASSAPALGQQHWTAFLIGAEEGARLGKEPRWLFPADCFLRTSWPSCLGARDSSNCWSQRQLREKAGLTKVCRTLRWSGLGLSAPSTDQEGVGGLRD